MKCKHYAPVQHRQVGIYSCWERRCLNANCGAWLSLGPSNDAPPEVAVEMRAAEIAADFIDGQHVKHCTSAVESAGWEIQRLLATGEAIEPDEWCTPNPESTSGYLARAIATHSDGDGQ